MKVGTDGVLLGLLTDPSASKTILDIGTGTGLLALMLAQKSDAQIDAIEIDEKAAIQAKNNFQKSGWKDRLNLFWTSLKDFEKEKKSINEYDLIICNPPFFKNSLNNPKIERNIARQTDGTFSKELFEFASKFLCEKGKLSIIIPFANLKEYDDLGKNSSLSVCKQIVIKSFYDSDPIRVILLFGKKMEKSTKSNFTIYDKNRIYSLQFKTEAKEYFLNF